MEHTPSYLDNLRSDIQPSYKDSLMHHGIKGMKWGVRRFQNKDGSLTKMGKNRYNVDEHMKLDSYSESKTKTGSTVKLVSQPSSRVAKFLAAHNKKIRTNVENTRNYDIKVNGKRIGDMTLYKESPDSMNVVWVGVDNSQRGQGYATAAMVGALKVAKKANCKHVTLEVPGNSPDAKHIYEKLGFKSQEKISEDDAWGGLTSMKLDF